ncbi:hypothetical protein BD414DRAFT_481758 [Trametes punicea]|nr:hypothetical protein BD414DRAFT_481758 [Trametes punicea]
MDFSSDTVLEQPERVPDVRPAGVSPRQLGYSTPEFHGLDVKDPKAVFCPAECDDCRLTSGRAFERRDGACRCGAIAVAVIGKQPESPVQRRSINSLVWPRAQSSSLPALQGWAAASK